MKPPIETKFSIRDRVRIVGDPFWDIREVPGQGKLATVTFTDTMMFLGRTLTKYGLDVDGLGRLSGYDEDQLSAI